MKKFITLFSFILCFSASAVPFVMDKIEAVVFGHEETVIITKSDIDRPSLDGVFRSMDDVIMEQLMFLEAKKYKIMPDENAINRYLESVQRENNLSRSDLMTMFTSAGYTYEEGRAQLGTMFSVNSLLDFKIRSRLIVMEQDVQKYYDDHPVYQEASYQLRNMIVPFNDLISREDQKAKIEDQIKKGLDVFGATWSQAFRINKSDIAVDKQFIVSMAPKTISFPREITQGFELFELVDMKEERLVPLEERYREISNILRAPRHDELFKEFQKGLIDSSSILRL